MGKRKRRIEEKEEELLSEQLKKTKIEIYECWTHIVISIVTMLIAVVTAVLTWFKECSEKQLGSRGDKFSSCYQVYHRGGRK